MRVIEAKELVLGLMNADIRRQSLRVLIDSRPPDSRDPGKFLLQARVARVIHRFSGWHVPIQLSWFKGSDEPPRIAGESFYWYVFAVPAYGRFIDPHYFICDYAQMRRWVLEFDAPLGDEHRDHNDWRADVQPYFASPESGLGYFRWGDEPRHEQVRLSRVIRLNNVAELDPMKQISGARRTIPESEAHRRLKLYVASHPETLGLVGSWAPSIEHGFATGDQADVLFRGPGDSLCVVEIEVEGEEQLEIGIHQAIKYRSLAAAQAGIPLTSSDISAFLVAYRTDYKRVLALSEKYAVRTVAVRSESLFPKADANGGLVPYAQRGQSVA